MKVLHIRLLGEFSLVYNDQPLMSVHTARLQSLLSFLVLHRGIPQSRRYLAFLFWPDSSEAQARTNLRKLFHQLHQALPEAEQFLHADVQTLQWRADAPFSLDVADFERALSEAHSIEQLKTAVDLYGGDLLPDCYDDWVIPERERFRRMYAETLERVINQLEGKHEYRAAISYAQRLLRLEPLCEVTYRDLLRLYAMTGDRAGVVRVYRTCVAVLHQELDVEPSPETQAVYERSMEMAAEIGSVPESPIQPAEEQNNLPLMLTCFIGRKVEMDQVKRLLLKHRLVTLTGAGGIGKTRLAFAVAGELLGSFDDGIWHIDLSVLSDSLNVVSTIATVLGVREESEHPLLESLAQYLRDKRLLLVLDNCEHLVQEVRRVVEYILLTAPDVRILVTSRVVLGMTGEVTWRVPPLDTPDMSQWAIGDRLTGLRGYQDLVTTLGQYESVQFFLDRAAAVLPTFTMTNENAGEIGRICQHLDGIPLALELAATRVRLLTVKQIVDHLQDALNLLSHGRPASLPRHQTLQATLDWSYALLESQEKALFLLLAVFAGSFTVEAAEFVGSGEGIKHGQVLNGLAGLVDHSLVSVEQVGSEMRFRLHEVTRQYAHVRLLESGKEARIYEKHLEYYCRLAESLEANLHGTLPPGAFERLTMEYDNMRAALERSTQESGNALLGLRLAIALTDFWELRGQLTAERGWLEMLLTRVGTDIDPALRAKALRGAGKIAYYQCDYKTARMFFEQSLVIDRELNNRARTADTLSRLGFLCGIQQDDESAVPFYQESLALYRQLDDRSGIGRVLSELGYIVMRQEDYSQAQSLLEESLTYLCKPEDQYLEARARHYLGHTARLTSNYAQARANYMRSTLILKEMKNTWGLFYILEAFACLAVAEAQWERAARLFGAVERLGETIGVIMAPIEQVECDRNISITRAQLGEKYFEAVMTEGMALSLDEAIAYALETPSIAGS